MLNPASKIIGALAGPGKVATIVGVHRTRVSNWMRPKDKGGTGGIIPQKHHPVLLAYAHEHGLSLSANDFLPTRQTITETGATA